MEQILDLMDDRRYVKKRNPVLYRILHKAIKPKRTSLEVGWLKEQCAYVEKLVRQRFNEIKDKIKQMPSRHFKTANFCIKKADRSVAVGMSEVMEKSEE